MGKRTFIETYAKPNKRTWIDDVYHSKDFVKFFGDIYLDEIKPLKIEEYKKWKKEQAVKSATVNRSLASLRIMLNKAVEWGILKESPMKKIKFYKENNQRMRYLEVDEIERLLKGSASHLRDIVLFDLNTGLRRGEIFNLKWSNIDIRNGRIYIHQSKTQEKRVIPMNGVILRLLLNIRERSASEYVFCNKDNGKIKAIRTAFKSALKRAGINDFRFHDLRHSFAAHYLMSGGHIFALKEILGHKKIEMTMRYSHFSQEGKLKELEALGDKMDTLWSFSNNVKSVQNINFLKSTENKRILKGALVQT